MRGVLATLSCVSVCFFFFFAWRTENIVVMLVLLYTILNEGGRGSDGAAKLDKYLTLVEESNGFGLTVQLMNEHEDMEIYDKVQYSAHRSNL